MKTKHVAATAICKVENIPADLKAASTEEADGYAYATVETIDRDNDIVRVKGISLRNHRAESPIKLHACHLRTLPSGELPLIGKVLAFRETTHPDLKVPALVFSYKYATTPLGKHYHTLDKDGVLTDFSIGFKVHKAEPLGQDKGLDFKQTELMEVSAVALPANEHASVMRAFDETYPETKDDSVLDRLAAIERFIAGSVGGYVEWTKDSSGQPCKHYNILDILTQITSRLDDIECAVEGSKAERSEEQPAARATTPPAQSVTVHADTVNAIKALAARL